MLSKCLWILVLLVTAIQAEDVCNILCDGVESSLVNETRVVASTTIGPRILSLYVADTENMAYGFIYNGQPGDELWLDRSFDGAISWINDSKLGETDIADDEGSLVTLMFNVDDPITRRIGALRACARLGDTEEIECTKWARSAVNAETPIDAAATAMMQFYNINGTFTSTGWWNSANCLTALIDYSRETGSTVYRYAIETTFEKNSDKFYGNFTNEYVDDTLWWGLAWLDAYVLTGESKYLEMAKIDCDFAYGFKDDVCGGGLWWTDAKTYKNAIPNELFIKLAAGLHNQIPDETKYLTQAIEVWTWFNGSGMINEENLINDGLNAECVNNRENTWTYNQGVILGGLLELFKATEDENYLSEAIAIVEAVIGSSYLNNEDGILRDNPCEDCGGDVPSFKGSFIRNLGELDRFLEERPYLTYLEKQVTSLFGHNRNSLDQYGSHWAGPFDSADGARQHCALEAYTAAYVPVIEP